MIDIKIALLSVASALFVIFVVLMSLAIVGWITDYFEYKNKKIMLLSYLLDFIGTTKDDYQNELPPIPDTVPLDRLDAFNTVLKGFSVHLRKDNELKDVVTILLHYNNVSYMRALRQNNQTCKIYGKMKKSYYKLGILLWN